MTTLSKLRGALTRSFTDSPRVQAAAIALFAGLLTFPCLLRGVSPGYDARTHVNYQHHFSAQFWAGDVYPRWLPGANKGYGSPTFLIQYPLPYFLTALLRPIMPFRATPDREGRELGVAVFLLVASAGIASWHWMKRFAAGTAATLAALAYMSLPYLLICVHVRAAIGELCTLVFMPLALACCEAMHEKHGALFLLSTSLALLIASNPLIAILFTPVAAIYALQVARQMGVRLAPTVARLTVSISLGAGIAGVYVVPFLVYRRLYNPAGMAANLPDFELGRYFLYVTSASLETPETLFCTTGTIGLVLASGWCIWRMRPRLLVATLMAVIWVLGALTLVPELGVAVVRFYGFAMPQLNTCEWFMSGMALTLIATMTLGLLAFARLADQRNKRQAALIWIAVVAFGLMLPFSGPLWKALPALQTVQFPFRFGGIVTVAVAGLMATSLDSLLEGRKRRLGLFVYGLAVTCVVGVGMLVFRMDHRFGRSAKSVTYDVTRDIDVNYRMYVAPTYLSAFAESMGSRPWLYRADPPPGDGTLRLRLFGGEDCVRVVREGFRTLSVSSSCKSATRLVIGQLNLAPWRKIELDGSSGGSVLGTSPDGLIELSLPRGRQDLRLEFDVTREERWGVLGSAASLLVSCIGYVVLSRRSKGPGPVHSPQ